jgi:thiamine biosynthesis lipoprotein
MGTVVSIDVRSQLPPSRRSGAIAAAAAVLHRADEDFSTFLPGSWVSRIRRGEVGIDDCPDQVRRVYQLARDCRDRTGGGFDPAWRRDGTLDPTGLVKGWAADAASAALTDAGATDHCVNAAGDLRIRGSSGPGRPWRIGIADPFDRGRLVAVVEGTDLAVATSGTSERGDHIVNPHTGAPATGLAAVTLVGPDLALADAYATAAFAAGEEATTLLRDLAGEGWAWLLVTASGRIDHCAHFPGLVATATTGGIPAATPG